MEAFIISKKKISYAILITFVLVGICVLIISFLNQNPLVISGYTEYDNGRKKVDIELQNKGSSDIWLHEIHVNGAAADDVQLVLSYTLQLVAGGIDDNPWAKFVQINSEPIHPQLLPEELAELDYPHAQPINYGVRILNETNVETLKIKYKYKGVMFIKEIKLDTWYLP